jgi:hypothetical protein
MHSRIAEESRQALQQTIARLTAEERLNAFLELCRSIAALKAAGDELRQRQRQRASRP